MVSLCDDAGCAEITTLCRAAVIFLLLDITVRPNKHQSAFRRDFWVLQWYK